MRSLVVVAVAAVGVLSGCASSGTPGPFVTMTPEPVQVTATATPPPEVVLEIPQECLDALDVAQSTLALDLEAFEAQAAALDAAKEAIRAGLDNRTVAFDDAVARMNEAEDSVSVDAVVGARDSFVSNRHACLVAVMD